MKLNNRYDFINMFIHERGWHGERFLSGERFNPNDRKIVDLWESEAKAKKN